MERTTLEEYVNGPYEEQPLFQSSGVIASTSETVGLRLYRDAFIVLRRAGRYTKYILDVNSTANAESYRSDEFSVRSSTGDVFVRVQGTDKRDTWVWHITQRINELQNEADRSARAAPSPASSEFKIAPLLAPSNALGSDVSADVSPRRGIEEDTRAVLRRGGIVVATFVLFACVYTAACRIRPAAAVLNAPAWMLVHPEFYIYPWALRGSKLATSLFVGVVVGLQIALTMWVRFLHDDRHEAYPDREYIWWGVARSLVNGFMQRNMAVVMFYFAYRRGAIPKRNPLTGRRGRCQFNVPQLHVILVVFFMIQGLSDDFIAFNVGFDPRYTQGTTVYFFCTLFIHLILIYLTRHMLQEYWWPALQHYTPLVVWGTYLLGRALLILIQWARAHIVTLNFDLVLAVLFVLYKIMFILLYPYGTYLTLRMGPHEYQMKFMFAFQVIDAIILDAFAVLSPTISSTYIIFMIMRVVFAVVYQAGILRKITDRLNITSPAWYDVPTDHRPAKPNSFLATLFPTATSNLHLTAADRTEPSDAGFDVDSSQPSTARTLRSRGDTSARAEEKDNSPNEAVTATDADVSPATVSSGNGSSFRNSPRPLRIPALAPIPRISSTGGTGTGTAMPINEMSTFDAAIMFPRQSPGRAATHGKLRRSMSAESSSEQTSAASVAGATAEAEAKKTELPANKPAKEVKRSREALLRETFGDSPLARWLFFVQSVMAGLMSSLGLVAMTAVDKALPGLCILTCDMPLSIIELRAVISLVTWLVTLGLTFAVAYTNMRRYGFSKEELAQLTSRHLRQSLPYLMSCGLPVACYLSDFVGGYAQQILGRTPNPLTVPLYNQ